MADLFDLLDDDGQLKNLSAAHYDAFKRLDLRLWAHHHARYGIPTIELVDWLRAKINGRIALEIGSGAGDLARMLDIRATDSKMQDDPEVRLYYALIKQPVIKYPSWVTKIEAIEAVKRYKPQVVIAQWVTHWVDPNLPLPPGGGCILGVKEDELLPLVETYIMIGNRRVHANKPILTLPHEEHRLPFIRSRATYPEDDVVWVWNNVQALHR